MDVGRLLSKQSCRDILLGLGLLLAALALVVWPGESMSAMKDGLSLCGNVILPSLFPFFVLSSLVVELKAERGNHDALAAATCAMLDQYKVLYCIESFDPRCIRWLKKNRPEIVRGQLSENFLRHGDGGNMPKALLWALGNLLTNCLAKPDFIAYRFSDRDNFCLRWCRWLYHVQEINWTIITKEEMRAAESAGNLVIFQDFDPRL